MGGPSTARALFTPFSLGSVELKHRIVMAPLTRMRCGEEGVPNDVVALHYEQRATDGGLLISEAANISPTARGYFGAPGLFEARQIEGWKTVTQRVHAKGGKIFAQLWHTGRVGHPMNQPGEQLPVSSSAVDMDDVTSSAITREGRKKHVTPRALELSELPQIAQDYKTAAQNAIAAGFDGVEIHSANGYLMEQFLCDKINKRTDAYGGPLENRARLIFEVVEGVLSALPSNRVGIRLSPYGITFGCTDSNPAETYGYVVNKLNDYNLAYLHLIEPRDSHFKGPLVPEGGITPIYRKVFKGPIITSSGYKRQEANDVIAQGGADLVAFGRDFIHNPDLVERLRIDAPLNVGNPKTYYIPPGTPLELGYTDYPFMEARNSSL